MRGLSAHSGGVRLKVRVQPRASSERVQVSTEGDVRVALTAPPVDGEANAALCAYLAAILGVSKSHVSLTGGEKSRNKTVTISGAEITAIKCALRNAAAVFNKG